MYYEINNPVTILEDGKHKGKIVDVKVWNNPGGPNKLILQIERNDLPPFSYFFTPGFDSFTDLIKMVGDSPKIKGEFDHEKLFGKWVEFETKITTAKNGNDYCNVTWIKEIEGEKEDQIDPFGEKKS